MTFRALLLALLLAVPPGATAQELTPSAPEKPSQVNQILETLDLTPGPDGKLSPAQMQELTRRVAENFLDNYKKERDYTFVRREVQNTLDGKDQVKSSETKTHDISQIYGEQVWRLIEKNDKPLDAKDAAKEDEKIQKIIDKRKNESEDDRKKREAKDAKQIEDLREFVRAVVETHTFTLVGSEVVDGRDAWVIEGEPREHSEAHEKGANLVSKFRGRLWIDKSDVQLAKFDIEATDTASVGWVLARIHKGTRVLLQRSRINDEVWLPQSLSYKLDARVALFKGYKVDAQVTYRDYKKFRTSSKIVGMGEVPAEK